MPYQIKISVGCPWEKEEAGRVRPPAKDARWQSIRAILISVGNEVMTRVSRKVFEKADFTIAPTRLRGMHGRPLLGELRRRIQQSHILVMDIGSLEPNVPLNQNVLIELGMALSAHDEHSGRVFVLIPEGVPEPSDLRGLLMARYALNKGAMKIEDPSGFRAAIRSAIFSIAYESGALVPLSGALVEDEAPVGGSKRPGRKAAKPAGSRSSSRRK